MENFRAALAAIDEMKRDGVIAEYAIGGAMAMIFWSEPVPTFDVDVFALLPHDGLLVSLDPIYQWARRRGYAERAEHVVIEGVPVQIIPAHTALTEEAVATAASLTYEGQPVRVIQPHYLAAMALEGSARTARKYNLKLPDTR
jgi:hypothetical protein